MDDAAGQGTVNRRPGRERVPQQGCVRDRLSRRDERLRAPHRAQHRRVDARRRREASARDASDEAQLVPRSPRAAEQRRRPHGGPLRCEPPLHDRVELSQRHARAVEQTAEDRGARGKGEVRHDREWLGGQRYERGVARDHLDARIGTEAGLQLPERSRVELDRAHACAGLGEGSGERAAPGAQVEHERPGQDPGIPDELAGEGAATKCVASARPRLR